jgi:hypothetical protein
MDKNKLGIVICTTKSNNLESGFRRIYQYNSEGWSSTVYDTGTELRKVTNNSKSDPVHLIQFQSDGCNLCIIQPIPGRKDYQSAWIFIHKDIVLLKGQLTSIMQEVENILKLDISDNKDKLDNIFNKTYQTKNSPNYAASSGNDYAVRYYGRESDFQYDINDLLGEFLYQSEYSEYKSVFLIDKGSGQTVTEAKDISKRKLKNNLPIELKDTFGFKPDSYSFRLTEGQDAIVIWTCPGFEKITKKGKTADDLVIEQTDIIKQVPCKFFKVIDKNTNQNLNVPFDYFRFKNAWNDISSTHDCFLFKMNDLQKGITATVKIRSYQEGEVIFNLDTLTSQNITIELKPESHEYNCQIITNIPDVRQIHFKIKTQHKLTGTEIPGFKFEHGPTETRINTLRASQSADSHIGESGTTRGGKNEPQNRVAPKDKKRGYWYVGVFILLIVGSICVWQICGSDKDEEAPTSSDLPEDSSHDDMTSDWDIAFDYLNNHTTLKKAEMDSLDALKGVYNMIKDYKFKDLAGFIESHKDSLMNIVCWKSLYDIAKKYDDKLGTYPSSEINIDDYLKYDFDKLKNLGNTINDNSARGTDNNRQNDTGQEESIKSNDKTTSQQEKPKSTSGSVSNPKKDNQGSGGSGNNQEAFK